ncbi:hypothetical protein MTY66_61880 (plasmid) [Mycolicibacterium sp. TY66]|nr:hypothetical protein MTY66_61880 [Mycolicibacterium sp. TY66]BCJ84793.1 hypothetical protein MTY81_61660 [Mycolicibacterium sp. TY81]
MLHTNRGKPHGDTGDVLAWYREMRPQFGPWKYVELTFETPGPGVAGRPKVIRFVDVQENALELLGLNFGYRGHTPADVVKILVSEGFNQERAAAVVFNESETVRYPQTIAR